MEAFDTFVKIEAKVNKLYSFYHSSPKREMDLVNFAAARGKTVVKLNKIIPNR